MHQKSKVIVNGGQTEFIPPPDRILITSVCLDIDRDNRNEMPSSINRRGFQDGFGEYSTHLPEKYN
jgi:hypothetical protein